MSVKKPVFGTPEKIKPSDFCKGFNYVEGEVGYDCADFIRGVVTSGFSGLLRAPEARHAESGEEFLRRLQTVVFSAQCLINGWYCEELPWLKFGCEDKVRRWINERERLKPYLRKAFDDYRTTGKPPVRALVSDYTGDRETYAIDDEYLFCDDFVVAPVKVGERGRRVYLPDGNREDRFTGEPHKPGWFEVEGGDIRVYRRVSTQQLSASGARKRRII